MSITRGYYGLLAATGALALVTQIPGVLLMAFVLFIMPGVVLLVGSNLFIYMLALLPVLWVLTAKPRRWVLLVPALMPATAMALLPREYSERAYGVVETQVVNGDFSKPATLKPATVAITGNDWEQGCTVLCEKLLFGGHVKAVIVGATRFRVEKHETCPEVGESNRRMQIHAASGRCLVSEGVAMSYAAADVVVETDNLMHSMQLSKFRVKEENKYAPFVVERAVRHNVYEAGVLVERRTQLAGATITAPLLIGGDSVQGSLNGFVSLARSERKTHVESVEAMLQRRYGWELVDVRPPEGGSYYRNEAPIEAEVFASILKRAHETGAELSKSDSYAIVQGTRQVLSKSVLAAADFAQLREVMQLRSFRDSAYFPTSSRQWRDDMAVLIPDAVARIETPYAKDDWFAANMFGFLASSPRELVRPYAARIDAVLKSDRGDKASRLLRVLNEVSPEPVSVLKIWTRTRDGGEMYKSDLLEGALVGLCRAAKPGDPVAAEAFRDFFENELSQNTPHYQTWAAIAGLAHVSGIEEVRRVTAYPDEKRRKIIERPFRIAMEKPWPENCARY